jgi:uncharacterized protein YegP (UPF0339 family)
MIVHIVINKNAAGEYYFALHGKRGKAVMTSPAYANSYNMQRGLQRVLEMFAKGVVSVTDKTGDKPAEPNTNAI